MVTELGKEEKMQKFLLDNKEIADEIEGMIRRKIVLVRKNKNN